ncbi:cytochrome c oxidase assembly protein [Neobacillus rhizophilus]|uniref:Cytochrome c oxidase assembly protein n=1 Tax=Neobacillus rhizophilus TaxID=2833579 RepID=A0A942U3P8_9BACI|nr:cytochrome c oxidase assembly protein [Neobacillus rhizophilus]MBS4211009.1 cytochrome c oxidase assembly protein [Neobacillus rhizophilus]
MHSNNHVTHYLDDTFLQVVLLIPLVLVLFLYLLAISLLKYRKKSWPSNRTFFFVLAICCAVAAVSGPLAVRAHQDFTAHMLGHLLLGMLAPLLMVLAAPLTLILRTLNVITARRLVSFLKKRYFLFLGDPVVASLLNVGGLWVLYTSDLYLTMHKHTLVYVAVHLHVFLGGYIFTSAHVYIDPIPHRRSFVYRGIVMVAAFAGHGILSKYIYAHPPAGVPAGQAELGGMLMYYGGDAIDLIIVVIFCYQWYKESRPRVKAASESRTL